MADPFADEDEDDLLLDEEEEELEPLEFDEEEEELEVDLEFDEEEEPLEEEPLEEEVPEEEGFVDAPSVEEEEIDAASDPGEPAPVVDEEVVPEAEGTDDRENVYWASIVDPERFSFELMERIADYYNTAERTGMARRWQSMFRAYYGFDVEGSFHASSEIGFSGVRGELIEFKANQLRSLATHIHVAATQDRPRFEPRAINTDIESLEQVETAEGVLEHYMIEGGLEQRWAEAVELSLMLAEGFLTYTWDPDAGEAVTPTDATPNEETGQVESVPQGDFIFDVKGPMDVIRDWRRPAHKQDWMCVRDFVNKYDLIADYPAYASKILDVDPSESLPWWERVMRDEDTGVDPDLIPVYHFYHRKTAALPEGRYALLLGRDLVLWSQPLPYKSIPVVRIAPAEFYGSCFGYSQLWDLQSLQRVLDMLVSAATTNYDAFGVQVVAAPKGSDFSRDDIGKGMALLYYPPGQQPPQGINLTAMPEGYLDFAKFIISLMETQSGVNAVARGNPSEALGAGAPASAMALLQNQFIQYNSGTVKTAMQGLEEVGKGILDTLALHASNLPRTLMVAGKDKVKRLQEVTGDDVSRIGRIAVDVTKAQTRTMAWRFSMLQFLLEYGRHMGEPVFDGPHSILEVAKTGNLDTAYEGKQAEIMLVKRENAAMMRGEMIQSIYFDDHALHIAEHKALLADPVVRKDMQVLKIVLEHVKGHEELQATELMAQANQQMASGAAQGDPESGEKPGGGSSKPTPGKPAGEDQAEAGGEPPMPKDPTSGEAPGVGAA